MKTKKRTIEEMQSAIDTVKTGMGVNAVARSHGVSKSTLKDTICGDFYMEANQGLINT